MQFSILVTGDLLKETVNVGKRSGAEEPSGKTGKFLKDLMLIFSRLKTIREREMSPLVVVVSTACASILSPCVGTSPLSFRHTWPPCHRDEEGLRALPQCLIW